MIKKIAWGSGTNGPLEMTYSDAGKYIERNGVRYESAVDPAGSRRRYRETKEDIPEWKNPTSTEGAEEKVDHEDKADTTEGE